ncbi:MAG: hypothetical protein Q9161_002255 [Pseudevernia consocians]
MTPATFETDNYMPGLTDDFDFGAFPKFPPDDDDQGHEDGEPFFLWGRTWSGHASDLMPELRDERRMDTPGPYLSTRRGSYESSEARQSTNTQLQTKDALPAIGYGASNLYGDEAGASGFLRPASATVLKTTGSETVAVGDCGEYPLVYSRAKTPPHLEIWKHDNSHYGQPGKYTSLEQNCQVVTTNFGDLKRHYKAKHCTKYDKEQFPYSVLWCKYSGNNGFARKDKLKSHYKNIHEGKPRPVKAGQVIKPARLKPQVSIFKSTTGKANK